MRRIHTEPVLTDEALHRDLQWYPSENLRRYHIAGGYDDRIEISEQEAEAAILSVTAANDGLNLLLRAARRLGRSPRRLGRVRRDLVVGL